MSQIGDATSRLKTLERLLRSTKARVILASTLIAVGAWSFSPYVFSRVAPAAFINAEIVRVTAPIGGQLTQDLPRKGALISATTNLPLIQSITVDRSRLVEIEQEYKVAKQSAALAQVQLNELNQADKDFARRTQDYQSAQQNRLDLEIREIEQEISACREEETVRRNAKIRAEEMLEKQLLSRMRLDVISGDYFKAVEACRSIAGRQQHLLAERGAMQNGTFVQDGTGAPFSEQERSRLLLSRQEAERKLLETRSRVDQLSAAMAAVRDHFNRLDHYDVTLPGGYLVWSVQASPGSAVVEGQTILELADCNNSFAVVEFPERDLASIHIGDSADIRLVGENEWRKGRVLRVRGSAAKNDERLFAAAMPDPKDDHIVVELSIAHDGADTGVGRACDIGRLAEVRLQRYPADFLPWFHRGEEKNPKLVTAEPGRVAVVDRH